MRKTTKWQAAVAATILGCACSGWAALEYVETFGGTSASEWGGRGSASVQTNGGMLEACFEQQTMVPMPETGAMVATNTASGGAFSGNYTAAGLDEIGFRFLAADVKPSGAILRIFGRERAYVKALDLSELTTGEWKPYRVSLEGLAEGGWNGGGATEAEFQEDLRDVQWLEVQVTRRGAEAQRYCLDDFSLHTKAESNRPPMLNFISAQITEEGQQLEFQVTATDADGTVPELTAYALPPDAEFTIAGDGSGQFVWTAPVGSHGVWPVRFTASDGEIETFQIVRIYVGEPGEGMEGIPPSLASWEPGFDDLLAHTLSDIATAEWQGRDGMLYDVYMSDEAPVEGVEWTLLQENVAGAGNGRTNAIDDVNLGVERMHRFYRLAFADEIPNHRGAWGVIRREMPPATASLMSAPLRLADRRFAGRMGATLAECLEGSDEGPGTGGAEVYLLDESGAWVLLYLDSEGVWRDVGGAAANAELAPGQGFWVVRNGTETVKATFAGCVGTVGEDSLVLNAGYNLVGIAEGVMTSLAETLGRVAAQAGTSRETADCVILSNHGGWRTLMFIEGAGEGGSAAWVDAQTSTPIGANEQLEPGSAFYYLRRGEPTELVF